MPSTKHFRLVILVALVSCSSRTFAPEAGAPEPSSRRAPASTSDAVAAELPSRVQALAVTGFLPAVVLVPPGDGIRPLVVAAHGAGGAPEWDCEYWARLIAERAFILCLRGTRISAQGGFYFRDHHALDAELTAAVAAARRAFSRIAIGAGVYVGFSQGATMGSLIIGKHAGEFPYAVLVEGFQQWSVPLARAFGQRGGKAILFACGSRECSKTADACRRALERAGLRARAEYAPGAGHTSGGSVERLVSQNLSWLVTGDAAWAN